MRTRLLQSCLATWAGVAALGMAAGTASPAGAAGPEPSIVAAPILVAHTSDGTVSYRSIGHGPTLLLIMGYSSSMDGWPPVFVDALAEQYRVITFDNAGIGQTSLPAGTVSPANPVAPPVTTGTAPPSSPATSAGTTSEKITLSMSTMATQTNALIHTLRLGRIHVLGWSMGGMIAQALTVMYPSDVSKLILCATLPGNGKGTAPQVSDLAALDNPSASSAALAGLLFPPDQQAKEVPAFIEQVAEYPNLYLAPADIDQAQFTALAEWYTGEDPAGAGIDHITVPTLIGDGADDDLIPVANDYEMHSVIRHSTLVLYPDAGHGFLFQDSSRWVATIERFLGT